MFLDAIFGSNEKTEGEKQAAQSRENLPCTKLGEPDGAIDGSDAERDGR